MNDWELVTKVISGDREYYGNLVDRYKNQIFALAYRFTQNYTQAQDLSQEIFVQCFLHLENFDNKSKFSTWLYRLAMNKCIDWQRKNKKEPELVELIDVNLSTNQQSPEDEYLSKEKNMWLRESLESLPEKYKVVLYLYLNQELTYGEIGNILGLPVKTIETRIYRGKRLLKEKLNSGQEVVKNELSPNRA